MGSQGSPSFVSAARQGHWSEGSFSPWALLICPFLSTSGRNSFVLGVTLTYCFFASPLPAERKQGDCKASPNQVSRVCAVLVDRWLMDSVGLFQWKFPTIWYWSGSFEWCFYHSFSRLIKNFLFLSGNCVSCRGSSNPSVTSISIQCGFVVFLQHFTNRDGISYSGLLSSPELLEMYSDFSFFPSVMICSFSRC